MGIKVFDAGGSKKSACSRKNRSQTMELGKNRR